MCQSSEYGTVVYARVTQFGICLNMAQDASMISEYALMSLNMSEHGWILLHVLNMAGNAWINSSHPDPGQRKKLT